MRFSLSSHDKQVEEEPAVDDVVVLNCFSKMMMAAGAESPSVATQSAKTDILQKIGQRGNNHQDTASATATQHQLMEEEDIEDIVKEPEQQGETMVVKENSEIEVRCWKNLRISFFFRAYRMDP